MDQMSEKRANIFHFKTLPKFTQIWIFGSNIPYHLAILSQHLWRLRTGNRNLFFVGAFTAMDSKMCYT
jgi:hypothetical protein